MNFTQKALSGIYLGTITKWNDPEISKANSGVNLPNSEIVVVHRADGSGTTYIFTDFLSKISDDWKNKVGKGTSPQWPVGLGGKGNEGVAGLVKQTAGSIGYVELIYAVQNDISYGKVQNAAGKFVKADLSGVTAAAAASAKDMPEDFRVSITNAPGPAVYPISSFTWLLIPAQISDAAKRDAIKGFLKWMLTDGQGYNEGLSYAKLPKPVVEKELKAIALISSMTATATTIQHAAPASFGAACLDTKLRHGDEIAHVLTLTFAAAILLLTSMLVWELWVNSHLSRAKFGWNFFWTQTWDPIFDNFGALHSFMELSSLQSSRW